MKKYAMAPLVALLVAVGVVLGTGSSASAAAQTASLRLEPLGDSITYGVDSSTGNGYRQPLWNELTGEGHPLDFVGTVRAGIMADPDNEGHPGYRIEQIAALTDASLAVYKPNVVALMAGTNDMIQNYQVSTAPARLSALVDQIVADDPTATVLVANLIIGTNANIAAFEPAYNATIPSMVAAKQAAGKHVAFVNMSALTAADLDPDGIHPNDGGYQKMADAWNTGVQTAASAGWITPPVANGIAPTGGAAGQVASGIAGKCLDVSNSSSANGTHVQLWTCNHTGAQSWTVYSDGTLRAFGKCLDATAAGTANGTMTQLYDCNGTGAQVWQSYNGGYRNMVSGRCLDDPASSTVDGTQLVLWDCNGGTNQKWSVPQPPVGPITSAIAGKCVDVNGAATANGTAIQIYDCNSSAAQQWTVAAGGALQAVGKCMDVTGSGTADGTKVQLYDCNGSGAQQWTYNASTKALTNPESGRCLDDPNSSTADLTQLQIWDCNATNAQQWTLP